MDTIKLKHSTKRTLRVHEPFKLNALCLCILLSMLHSTNVQYNIINRYNHKIKKLNYVTNNITNS